MFATVGAFFARSVLMQSPLGGPLKALFAALCRILRTSLRIPVWAIVIALIAGLHWHNGKVKAADAAGYSRAMREIEAKAIALKTKIDTLTSKISTELRSRNDDENRRIARDADTLRLRGPGKASCPGGAGLPASSGGHVAAGRLGDAAGSQVPGGDRAAVPWGWLVDRAEEHDAYRAEALAWREWYRRLSEIWPKADPRPASVSGAKAKASTGG